LSTLRITIVNHKDLIVNCSGVFMNKLSTQERAQVVAAMVEGASINSTVRMTGISKPTILKLLKDLGTACKKYQEDKLRNLPSKRVQCDEIWSFCFGKDKNISAHLKGKFGFGSVWTWTALCADTKLMVSWLVGNRDGDTACTFIDDLAGRLAHRVQISTDGHKPYLEAIEGAFGADIDYGVIVKLYSNAPTGNETRYSPGECCGIKITRISGNPDLKHCSTSAYTGEPIRLAEATAVESVIRSDRAQGFKPFYWCLKKEHHPFRVLGVLLC